MTMDTSERDPIRNFTSSLVYIAMLQSIRRAKHADSISIESMTHRREYLPADLAAVKR